MNPQPQTTATPWAEKPRRGTRYGRLEETAAKMREKATLPAWYGRQRKKPAENKAHRLERVAAEMRAKRTPAQKSATKRWELTRQERWMTLNALSSFELKTGEQGADIWPPRDERGVLVKC